MRRCKIVDTGRMYTHYIRFFDIRYIDGKDKFDSYKACVQKGDTLPIVAKALHEHGYTMVYVVEKNGYYALIGERGIELINTCIQR